MQKTIYCPRCASDHIIGNGSQCGNQRCRCKDCGKSFQLSHTYNARKPGVKETAEEMAYNGSGARDTARVLRISPSTVVSLFKKKPKKSAT